MKKKKTIEQKGKSALSLMIGRMVLEEFERFEKKTSPKKEGCKNF